MAHPQIPFLIVYYADENREGKVGGKPASF